MTRLQKKCFLFSVGLHGLLAVVLFCSAGFGSAPQRISPQIVTVIPSRILDMVGVGGGSPIVTPAPPQPQPLAQPKAQPVAVEHVEPAHETASHQTEELPRPEPKPRETPDLSLEPRKKPQKAHEIHPTFDTASASTRHKTKAKNQPDEFAESTAHAKAARGRAIANALKGLASTVESSGSQTPSVDVSGIGGGEAFAGYNDVVISYYYHAWTTPDSVANRQAVVEARVTILRTGVVLSAEVTRSSGERTLDRSVERALREVTKLPPFPASATDQERTFTLQFSPEVKELSG
jgi:TonB family protein